MVTPHGSFQFLGKFQSLLGLCSKSPIFYPKIITVSIHSLRKPNRSSPFKKIIPKVNTKDKSTIKQKSANLPKVPYTREIITKIWNMLRYSTWDDAQEQLRNISIKWDSYTVNQVLKTHPPMEKAWLFFNWADKLRGFKHDQFTYTTMLDIFGEARRISSMMYLFKEMQEKGIKTDVVTYTSLLHWLSNDGDVDGAVKLWEEMNDRGCRPTVVSYTAYMKVLFDHNRVKEASEVYKEMLNAGCSPNCHTYTVLMEQLANCGKFNEAMEIFGKMQETGVQPDKAACNILVEKCCRKGNVWAMKQILQYMKENSLVLRHPIYVEALKCFEDARESDILLRQVNRHFSLERFNKNGTGGSYLLVTDVGLSLNGEILSLLKKKDLVAIDCLLTEMSNKSIVLESGIVSTIIDANISGSRESGAMLAFDYSLELGINLHHTAYLAFIGMFIRRNSFPKVIQVVEKMVREGLSLEMQLSAVLIYRLGCAREPDAAAKLFNLLPDEHKNTATYTALVGAFFASGNAVKGLETFETMRREGIKVALGTYCVLLSGLEKNGMVKEVDRYRKDKNKVQAVYYSQVKTAEENICDLLFARNMVV